MNELALLIALNGAARADRDTCVSCCKSEGLAGCPTRLRVYGPGSGVKREGPAWRVVGLWWVDCDDGAKFEEGATVALDHAPDDGEVVTVGTPPAAVTCYKATCRLPAEGCLEPTGDRWYLRRCGDGRPLAPLEWVNTGPAPAQGGRYASGEQGPATVVRIGGRTVIAQPAGGAVPASAPAVVIGGRSVGGGAPAPIVASRGTVLDLEIPDGPKKQCKTSQLLQDESGRHVALGDESAVAGDLQTAVNEYRAAISMHPCNATAWAALGGVALGVEKNEDAVAALRVATRLNPGHYGALTSLGVAYEAEGLATLAVEAYQKALAAKPGHPPAEEGLARVGGRR